MFRPRRALHTRLISLIALVVLFGGQALRAVQPYELKTVDPLLETWQWQRFSEFDGKEPRCLVEAADGAMWFGGDDGATRFDGIEWRTYSTESGLDASQVTALRRAAHGNLFAATSAGIFQFKDERWHRVFPEPNAPKLTIAAFECMPDGGMWASFAGGVVWLRGETGTLFTTPARLEAQREAFPKLNVVALPESLANRQVTSLFGDRDGGIWFGTNAGDLVRLDATASDFTAASAWRVFTSQDGFRRGRYSYVFCQTSDRRIWIGTDQHDVGLNCYDPATDKWSYVDLAGMFGTDSLVLSILQTTDGALWAGGLGKIFRYSDGKWKLYRSPDVPISSSRLTFCESSRGNLWLLGIGDDVQRIDFRGRRWLKYEGLNFQCETPDGRQWFVTVDDGIVCFDGQQWWRFGRDDGLMASPVALLHTKRGDLWAAGSEAGRAAIARFDGTSWHPIKFTRPELDFASIIDSRALCETADGSVWFGAYVNGRGTGILQYNPALGAPDDERAWRVHQHEVIQCSFGFATASDGTLFSGSYRGLGRFDGREWAKVYAKQVDAVAQSRDGQVWVGTRGTGVFRYTGAEPVPYTIKDGVSANGITALFFDRDNDLWVGTSKGISWFDGAEWVTDVFPGGRIAIAREGGGFRQSSDGAIWINQSSREWMRRTLRTDGVDSLTARNFWTARFRRDVTAPTTEIMTAVRQVSQPGNTAISWRGIDPWAKTPTGELRFSHRLDGGPWSKFTRDTNHVFLALPAGNHVFEVRARDGDLNIQNAPTRVEFEVIAPVWRQPWFIGLLGVLITTVITQSYRVIRRDQRLRSSNRELSAEIEERKKAESALREKTELLQEKTTELEDEIEERRAIQEELEIQKHSLEKEIDERKRAEQEVERIHKELMQASHQAGMAEVATSVLHNIGNVLNSVNVSATVAEDTLRQLKPQNLIQSAELLEAHAEEANFLSANEKGRMLPAYLRKLCERWSDMQKSATEELRIVRQNIEHIREVVATQQAYARFSGVNEKVKIRDLVENAIRMNADALDRQHVTVVREYEADAEIEIEKNKVLQILVNLIRNAKHACIETGRNDGRVVMRIREGAPGTIRVEVTDNGVGILPENMTRIFSHGFTTRKEGHGFGLHSAANAAKTIGAKLTAHSDGPGRGATFALEFTLAATPAVL